MPEKSVDEFMPCIQFQTLLLGDLQNTLIDYNTLYDNCYSVFSIKH